MPVLVMLERKCTLAASHTGESRRVFAVCPVKVRKMGQTVGRTDRQTGGCRTVTIRLTLDAGRFWR